MPLARWFGYDALWTANCLPHCYAKRMNGSLDTSVSSTGCGLKRKTLREPVEMQRSRSKRCIGMKCRTTCTFSIASKSPKCWSFIDHAAIGWTDVQPVRSIDAGMVPIFDMFSMCRIPDAQRKVTSITAPPVASIGG